MNTGAARAIFLGIKRAVGNWRIAVLLYFINFILAAVLAAPIVSILSGSVSKSLVGDQLVSGFSYRWYVEFLNSNLGFFKALVPQVAIVAALFLLVEMLFAGGLYPALTTDTRTKVKEIFSKGATNFFPVLLVTICQAALLAGLYELNTFWTSSGSLGSYGGTALSSMDYIRYVVVGILFMAICIVSDFSRAAVTIEEGNFAERFARGLSFPADHPLSSIGVFLGCAAISMLVIALLLVLDTGFIATSAQAVIVRIIVGQAIVLLRIFAKLIFYGGEAALYKEKQIEVITVKPEMLE